MDFRYTFTSANKNADGASLQEQQKTEKNTSEAKDLESLESQKTGMRLLNNGWGIMVNNNPKDRVRGKFYNN